MNRRARQSAFLIGSGDFRWPGRLTVFRRARNIVRIRTKGSASMLPGNAMRGVVTDLDYLAV
jgi:hypothetical protein